MEEVLHYQCFLTLEEFRLVLKGTRFRPLAVLVFRDDAAPSVDMSGEIPMMFLGRQDYHRCIDLLRNERPVFFEPSQDGERFRLRTGDEPVGENE